MLIFFFYLNKNLNAWLLFVTVYFDTSIATFTEDLT